MKRFTIKSSDAIERIAVRATKWIGSTNSLLVHTALFIISFALYFYGIGIDKILLVVTTIVSLEAIYLSIFIQMSVNRNVVRLRKVAKDIDEIQEDIDEIQEDVEEIEKDVDEIQEDIEEDIKEENKEDEVLSRIEDTLGKLIEEVIELKKQHTVIENKKKE